MKTIYKYEIPIEDPFTLTMPDGAEPLCVQMQDGVRCLWALVETTNPPRPTVFRLFGTGHPVDNAYLLRHVGTFQDGPFVGHVFAHHGR